MDDNNLITLLQQGDRNAYKQLFIKYYSPLCEYASQYISDDDSEELVQELMLFLLPQCDQENQYHGIHNQKIL